MARLQILELPEGSEDERPPFILVIDQALPERHVIVSGEVRVRSEWDTLAETIGARGVIVTPETIDIPANDTTAYLQQVAEEAGTTIGNAIRAATTQQLVDERTDIARDMDRLAKWKNELTDALGIDRTRDWDDIRNAAAGLRKERDAQAAAAQRMRDLHRPVEHRGQTICWACSDYDFPAQATDSTPVAYDQCVTLKALAGYPATSQEQP